jgi:uncharacterized protein YndB with AHSA1/START domain/ketosteroid isomerase-like protein
MTTRATLTGDELIATRYVDAGPTLVWTAFTTPEHLAAFWGGDHATIRSDSVAVDLRVGGAFQLETVGADGCSYPLRFRYEVIDPPRLLVFTAPDSGILTEVRLEPTGTGTTVVIHQRRLPPDLQTEQARGGLTGILERLAVVVAGSTADRRRSEKEQAMTDRQQTVHRYMEGFRRSDHAAILALLTEDVVWHIHGARTTRGKAEFAGEIENPAFEGSPVLEVDRTIEAGDVVVVTGVGQGRHREAGSFRFAFNDLFTFRGGLIAQVDSYVVPLG